jgi:hypothetical protein
MRVLAILLAVLAAAAAGCGDKQQAAPAKASAPAPSPVPVPDGIRPEEIPAGTAEQVEQLFVQLQQEKTQRPAVTPTVETVLGALEGAGIAFDEKKQVLALTVGAGYCMRAGNTASGLNVVVCEYASPDAVKKGVELLETKFAKVREGRTITTKGSTIIQVMDRPQRPLTDVRRTIDAALATL